MSESSKSNTSCKQLEVAFVRQQLYTQTFGIGENLIYVPVVGSTNTLAMQLARQGKQEGVVILTDSQTAGKGRQGRRWVDISGCNVLSSTILRPLFPPYLLVMLASLAVVDALAESYAVTATIKWPNDVLVRDRKVAGILIETSHDRSGQMIAIMGIGINVNGSVPQSLVSHPEEEVGPSLQATTLEMECGHAVSRETLISHLLYHIEASYLALQHEMVNTQLPSAKGASPSRSLSARWRAHLSTLGRAVHVRQGNSYISGVAEDVNDTGELLLRSHSGERVSITWGDVGYPTE